MAFGSPSRPPHPARSIVLPSWGAGDLPVEIAEGRTMARFLTTGLKRIRARWVSTPQRRRRLRALAMLAVAGLLLSACNWTMFRYVASHTGFNNAESVISVGNVSRLTQLFTGATGGVVNSSPAVVNGIAYVG